MSLMTSNPRFTHIEHANPGDEQAERREFEAWITFDDHPDGRPGPVAISLSERHARTIARRFERVVRCRVTIEEG